MKNKQVLYDNRESCEDDFKKISLILNLYKLNVSYIYINLGLLKYERGVLYSYILNISIMWKDINYMF